MWWALQAAGGNFSGNAEKIKNCLLSEYWDNAAGRFKGGRNNEQIFLDAQTWGAAFLKAIGENEKALQALSYAREVLREPAQGGQLFGFDGNAGPWSVWNEGTAQYIAVGGDGAGEVLPELLAQQEDGAMVGSPDEFSGGGVWTTRWHGVAPTAWLYNALCGEPFHPGSQPRCTAGVGEPSISSILRVDLNPTSATTVNFEVTFSEPVTNVDLSDFTLTTTGVKGATITSVVCSGAACTVTVNTGSIGESNGKIRLDVLDDDSIVNGGGDPLGGAGTGNGDFSWGDIYTIAAHVSVPVLLAPPKNRPVTNNSKPDFAWSAVTDADHYEIQFATNDAFTQSVDSQLVGDLSFTITNSLADGKYYWRVRAYNILNEAGSWSVSNYLTVDTLPPLPPILKFPANNVSVRGIPTFRWSTTNSGVQYQFQIDNDSDFSTPIFSVIQRSLYRRPPGILRGAYYWRVRAQDAAGNWSAWSEVFVVDILRLR